MSVELLAAEFVEALAVTDATTLRGLLSPDARFWVNIGPASFSVDERLALLEHERSHLRALAFEDVRTLPTSSGFVVQATTVMRTVGGADLRVPVCLVATTDDGVIVRVDEYADSAPATPLLERMSGDR
jgi:ketosteroid isomerase-like protein